MSPVHAFFRISLGGLLAVALLALPDRARAQGEENRPAATPTPHFEPDIQPILQAKCTRCHGSEKQKASLDLSSLGGVLKGSESGPVVVAGKADQSRLYEMVQSGKMPPGENARLSAADVATIRRWLDAGVPSVSTKLTPAHKLLAAKDTDQEEITQRQIVPMMLLHCTVCHGGQRREAGLDLRTKAGMLKGGKSGAALVPGKPEQSLILKKVSAGEMPPLQQLVQASVKPLTGDEVAKLKQWIARGAPEASWEPDVATSRPDPLVTDQDRAFLGLSIAADCCHSLPRPSASHGGSTCHRRLHSPETGGAGLGLGSGSRPPDAAAPREFRPPGAAADSRRMHGVFGRSGPRRV